MYYDVNRKPAPELTTLQLSSFDALRLPITFYDRPNSELLECNTGVHFENVREHRVLARDLNHRYYDWLQPRSNFVRSCAYTLSVELCYILYPVE